MNKYDKMCFLMFAEVFRKLAFKWFRKNDHIFSDELCRWYQENICTGTTYNKGQVGKVWDINDYDRRDRYFVRMKRLGIMDIKKERNKTGRVIKIWYRCIPSTEWSQSLLAKGMIELL